MGHSVTAGIVYKEVSRQMTLPDSRPSRSLTTYLLRRTKWLQRLSVQPCSQLHC